MRPAPTRRDMLAGMAAAAAGAQSLPAQSNTPGRPTLCAFSKHFHWTDVKEMCGICAGIGYEGIDLTVREAGHVLPERVADDLPKAAETIRKAGLQLPMITAGIVDVSSPHAEAIVKTMKSLGIRDYRWGGFRYQDTGSLPAQLAGFQAQVKDLAALNRQYGVCAMYHTHSGIGQVGASMWDLYLLLKDHDVNAVSANYDIGHATVEGGFGGWIHSSRLLMPYMRGVAVKDFVWKRNGRGEWVPGWCALGQGMVNFKRFFAMLKAAQFSGPLQLHMEYDELGGADTGKTKFTIPKAQLLAIFKRDFDTLKRLLREGGLA
jgi:L-ribulose-5-phosphate 3-epimerase